MTTMLTCMMFVCFMQMPSAIPDRMNYVVVNTKTAEKLTITWITPNKTKNVEDNTCWLYDGETMSNC